LATTTTDQGRKDAEKFPVLRTEVRERGALAGERSVKLDLRGVSVRYGDKRAVGGVTMPIFEHLVTAVIGPSGCGKSTLLRALNRMNDSNAVAHTEGAIELDGVDVLGRDTDVISLRRRVGMVFQHPNPFFKSIYDNVAFGPRVNNLVASRAELDDRVERALTSAALWDEVKDRLRASATSLSGGQQQRLCIARALAVEPEVILMDEPASALDPVATARIEELMFALKESYTIVVVTHNMQQAARVSDYTAFLLSGELVEFDETSKLFTKPSDERTEAYITGRFG
jgi:phosphate transport system ATP-binding protein